MSQRLSALDAAFLQVEDRQNRMQLAGMLIFKGQAPDPQHFRAAVGERLLGLPRFRQRLQQSTFGLGRPRWVDDDSFDLDYHLSRIALPSPGGHEEVAAHIDHMTSAPLDLSRPLWEVGLVEGLADGFAVSLKVHHCMVDGLSIIDIFTALLAPDSDLTPPPPNSPAPRGLAPVKAQAPSRLRRVQGAAKLLGQAPTSPFNTGDSGPTRRTAYVTVPLDSIHEVRKVHGTTVNNIVLAVVAGGLRRYLTRHDSMVDKLHAFVPVNRRPQDARGSLGNQIGMTYPALPVGEASPDARIMKVVRSVGEATASGQAATTATLMRLLGLAPAPLARSLNRAAQFNAGMFNLTVTNVPGPPGPVHFLGSDLELILGSTPLTKRHALTIAVLSYNGSLSFMVTTDPRRVPDGSEIAEDLRAELESLREQIALTSDFQGSPQ
ncbi:wax ester/triacylglycerol synthase family O-acyltransferase [Hoyosella subflava]|uniref:Diacylglycerol O-acyltransferase n=1 Tax=Hoyosella subflava (strain DSM 45089 / JCM 17490 / NBRC 109087 / DQS3-9A1) TaxID=443218 RepID=F6EFZ9_HOYSD|nr:wax ester/triacylglycerol synthase family O-acyltransferase [Hoyosella subflava]AEF38701.1 Acyltransferase, WS/DGAT/MGAT [Hoyosella subflava DQS3-9A1]